MGKRGSPPTRVAIARWWIRQPGNPFDISEMELSCFACGYYFNGRYDGSVEKANKMPLERAHIIAHSEGGPNDPSNYVLLCKKCHAAAPMSVSREHFLSWCERRPHYMRVQIDELVGELAHLGVNANEFTRGGVDMFSEWLAQKSVSLHGDPMFGPVIPVSTKAALIAEYHAEYHDIRRGVLEGHFEYGECPA